MTYCGVGGSDYFFIIFVKLEKASNNFGNSNFNSLVLKLVLVIILNVSYTDYIWYQRRLARRGRHPCHLTRTINLYHIIMNVMFYCFSGNLLVLP